MERRRRRPRPRARTKGGHLSDEGALLSSASTVRPGERWNAVEELLDTLRAKKPFDR